MNPECRQYHFMGCSFGLDKWQLSTDISFSLCSDHRHDVPETSLPATINCLPFKL